MAVIEQHKLWRVFATAEKCVDRAPEFLKRLGFVPDNSDVYVKPD